ncbi:hypothetical protein [Roseibium album]|uniref:hypothetical protein n=1 Tax=Roseibium album TaxID=311410 RepID=UPI0024937E59|nr:hypothetical protein [Roseibium album]
MSETSSPRNGEYLRLPSAAAWLRYARGMQESEMTGRDLKRLVDAGTIPAFWRAGTLVVSTEDLAVWHRSLLKKSKEASLERYDPRASHRRAV